jgi:hypothetical protein
MMHATTPPPFTPAELADAGRRAEAGGKADLAGRFYRALTEHFAEAPEAAEAREALGRIGAQALDDALDDRARTAGRRALARAMAVLGRLWPWAGPPSYRHTPVRGGDSRKSLMCA